MGDQEKPDDSNERSPVLESLADLQRSIDMYGGNPEWRRHLIADWFADFLPVFTAQTLPRDELRRLHEQAIANAHLYDTNGTPDSSEAPTVPDIDMSAGQSEEPAPPNFHWKFGIPMNLSMWDDTQPLSPLDAPNTPPEPPPTN